MTVSRFAVVFELIPAVADRSVSPLTTDLDLVADELEEIDELRRIGLEIAEPELRSYTRT